MLKVTRKFLCSCLDPLLLTSDKVVWPKLHCRQSRRDLLNWRLSMIIHTSTHHTGDILQNAVAAPTTHACSLGIVSFQFSTDGGRFLGGNRPPPTSGKMWCIPAALILPHASEQLSPTIRTRLASSRPFAGFAEREGTLDAQWQRGARPLNTTCSLVSSLSRCLDRDGAPSVAAAAVDSLQSTALHSRRITSHRIA